MKDVSISRESLAKSFADEKLAEPAVLAWPLEASAELRRRRREEAFRRRMEGGAAPGLEWMRNHASTKYRPDRVLDGCRTVLVAHLGLYRDDAADRRAGVLRTESGAPAGRIARYGRGRDYHKELGGRLRRIARVLAEAYPDHRFRAFTDIGPLDEVWLAEASGLGFRGRHSLAILRDLGSWVALGHILTTARVDAAPPRPAPLSCPAGCRRCLDACPTGALSMDGGLDPSLCLSCHTIEQSGPIREDLRGPAGDRVFGCDACQEACPFNAGAAPTTTEGFRTDIAGPRRPLAELLGLRDHDDVVNRFAGSALMRPGRNGLVRNACTAAGNAGDPSLVPELESLVEDADEGVREHARWALRRITGGIDYPEADSNG